MPDYKQNPLSGIEWYRFPSVMIGNPRGGVPLVSCQEQRIVSLGGEETASPAGQLQFAFDPAVSIPLLDPATNEPTGETATGAQVHQLVYSYVMMEALKRDAAALAAAQDA